MDGTSYRVTALLTEHFGFAPLNLIDDVINAVNHIMYKCTQAIETYLKERQENTLQDIKNNESLLRKFKENEKEVDNEIKVGTAKLETLLESLVDKNFDKFELYSLRNIFTLPHDLVEEGWIRLQHQEGLDFSSDNIEKKAELDTNIAKVLKDIKHELHLQKILKLQILKAEKLIKALKIFKESIVFLSKKDEQSSLSDEAKRALKSLSPLDESLYFLLNQVDDLINQTQTVTSKIMNNSNKNGINDIVFRPNLRDKYTDGKSLKILEEIGILDNENVTTIDSIDELDDSKSAYNVNTVQSINKELGNENRTSAFSSQYADS